MRYGYRYIPQTRETKNDAMIKALSSWWMYLIEHGVNIDKFTVEWVVSQTPEPSYWKIMGDAD